MDPPRLLTYNEESQREVTVDDVNFLEEVCCQAVVRSARYQQGLCHYHSRRVRPLDLEVGDWVLRRRQSTQGRAKLSSPWEGPYRVAHVLKPGVVCLVMEEGRPVNNSWNIEHLRKYHLQRFYP